VRRLHSALASPVFVGAIFFALYLSSGALVPGNDMRPSVFMPRALILEQKLTFTAAEYPFMFHWRVLGAQGSKPIAPRTPADIAAAAAHDTVLVIGAKYYLVATRLLDEHASIFGPVPGLLALPLVVAYALFDVDAALSPTGLAWSARWTAALLAALAVAFMHAVALRGRTKGRAALAALVLGAGTSLWSTTSQGLLQHAPCTLFVTMAVFALWTQQPSTVRLLGAGAALGVAVWSRPTALVVAVLLLGYSIIAHRRRALLVALGALPLALLLAFYNQALFGAPWTSAQTLVDPRLIHRIGAGAWSTPVAVGGAGLLLSPGRGLLVYSPVVLWSFAGVVLARGHERVRVRVLAAAVLGTWLIAFKWFDWWGGWCFGYRPLVDSMPLLVLCMLPAIDRLRVRSLQTVAFAAALAFSIGVQALGAFAYEPIGWNDQDGRDVNKSEHRARLWAWRESPILYYATHFAEARARRLELARQWVEDPGI